MPVRRVGGVIVYRSTLGVASSIRLGWTLGWHRLKGGLSGYDDDRFDAIAHRALCGGVCGVECRWPARGGSGATKLIVLDTLGAMLSASRPIFPGPKRLAEFVELHGNGGPCSIIGMALKASATDAALMNGYLAYALDIESHHGPAIVHAAATILPAALADAQQLGCSGERLLTAVALGIEVACRVSLAIGPNDLYNRGFHPTAIAGSFGAAAAVASLRNLGAAEFARAFGLAATMTGGLLAWSSDESEESRPFNPGTAARNGLTAGRLAALGFGAPVGVFDQSMNTTSSVPGPKMGAESRSNCSPGWASVSQSTNGLSSDTPAVHSSPWR